MQSENICIRTINIAALYALCRLNFSHPNKIPPSIIPVNAKNIAHNIYAYGNGSAALGAIKNTTNSSALPLKIQVIIPENRNKAENIPHAFIQLMKSLILAQDERWRRA